MTLNYINTCSVCFIVGRFSCR